MYENKAMTEKIFSMLVFFIFSQSKHLYFCFIQKKIYKFSIYKSFLELI